MQRAERIDIAQKLFSQTHYNSLFRIEERKEFMGPRELRKIDKRIKTLKKTAQELKNLAGGIPAVDRNTERILASIKMLEINISDLVDLGHSV